MAARPARGSGGALAGSFMLAVVGCSLEPDYEPPFASAISVPNELSPASAPGQIGAGGAMGSACESTPCADVMLLNPDQSAAVPPAPAGATEVPSVAEHCTDGAFGPGEGLIDCGGECAPCPCTPGEFLTPEPLTPLFPGEAWSPELSVDGSLLLFGGIPATPGGQPEAVYVAERLRALGVAFAEPRLLAVEGLTVNGAPVSFGTPWLSRDQLRMYLFRGGAFAARDLILVQRSALAEPFALVQEVEGVNAQFARDDHPWLSDDELSVVFTSARGMGALGATDLWRATRAATTEDFGAPQAITELNSPSEDFSYAESPGGLEAFFVSSRTGNLEIHVAARTSVQEPFATPSVVAATAATSSEWDVTLSRSGSELLFTSDRDGNRRLWRALRCPSP